MNITVINQHTSNHGDEAAGKALLRKLQSYNSIDNIYVLYNAGKISEDEYVLTGHKIENIIIKRKFKLYDKVALISSMLLPIGISKYLLFMSTILREQYRVIYNSEVVVNAPGGVNIGPYQDWVYLWRLYISIKLKKPTAIYSISFGPIPKNILFNRISRYVLKNSTFISLRDEKSEVYAKELGINFISSIDTAFLDDYADNNFELQKFANNDYVVIVPNQLYNWHPNFKKLGDSTLDKLYLKIINYFLEKNVNVVLLPQLFGSQNDIHYFKKLCNMLGNTDGVFIASETLSSDMQQSIVRNAKFLIGARYHSIVFSIRNNTPFLSLSYEHKMENMLSKLNLDNYNVSLVENMNNEVLNHEDILNKVDKCFNQGEYLELEKKSDEVKKIAVDTFEKFISYFRVRK
ncbi:colanic acid/amylovoran biosynthesis protein [Methanococcus maripaludis]|uniref:Colanic acid/amylovoran biosynthesis protein n=1 Tax=Methanococcus maripaludis TaxID=39152 RepID=A0A7J9P0S4_METMI|nr:polysaccharide pyruvyl transferase family protein [Methanococcus maripaludis]MBA2853111.1 colanic acid/amylovoran biosynthesis protein [Methanococcus maripaludis]